MNNDWAVSIDLTDAYLHVPQSRKYLRFVHEDQIFQFMALPFGMPKSVDFHHIDGAAHLRQRTISVFPYLDDWLIKQLIHNRLLYQTKYCPQLIESLDFIPNLKKSELIPAQNFTFIGMEFLTQQNLVRVPTERVQTLIREDIRRRRGRHAHLFSADIALFKQESDVKVALIFFSAYCLS